MENATSNQIICPHCQTLVDATAFYCPMCGKNLRESPLSTSVLTQFGLYAVSILLPPFFVGWTIKYIKSSDQKAKKIGLISLGLTLLSLTIALWLSLTFIKNLSQGVNTQLEQYQDLGL